MPPRRKHGGRAGAVPPKVRAFQRQVQALQEEICRALNVAIGDESEEDNEDEEIGQGGEGKGEVLNQVEERLFRAISNLGKRPKFDVGMCLGNLNPNELIYWINELEEYFEYEAIEDPDRVKFAKAKMKCHGKIWG